MSNEIDKGEDTQAHEKLRIEIIESITGYCEGATVNDPKIIALNDLAELYAATSRIEEIPDKQEPTSQDIAAYIEQLTIAREIRTKRITIMGYNDAHVYLEGQTSSLVKVWGNLSKTAHFISDDTPPNPHGHASEELRTIVNKLTESPNFQQEAALAPLPAQEARTISPTNPRLRKWASRFPRHKK